MVIAQNHCGNPQWETSIIERRRVLNTADTAHINWADGCAYYTTHVQPAANGSQRTVSVVTARFVSLCPVSVIKCRNAISQGLDSVWVFIFPYSGHGLPCWSIFVRITERTWLCPLQLYPPCGLCWKREGQHVTWWKYVEDLVEVILYCTLWY